MPSSLAELERFLFLDDTDKALVNRPRGDHIRLGFSPQLGTVRLKGSFLADPLDMSTEMVDFVAGQLGVADLSCLKTDGEREKTRLPGATVLARLIAQVRDGAMQRLWDVMASMLTAKQARLVGRLPEVPEGGWAFGPGTVAGGTLAAVLVEHGRALGSGS